MTKVIDLSVYQGLTNDQNIVNDFDAVIARASSGASYIDPTFAGHWSVFSTLLPFSAYHVLLPIYSPQANLANFIAALNGRELDFGPFLDIELTTGLGGSALAVRVRDTLSAFKSIFPNTAVYSGAWWWNKNIGPASWQNYYEYWGAGYPLLLNAKKEAADWTSMPDYYIPPNWRSDKIAGWQYTSTYPNPARYVQSKGLDASVWFKEIGAAEPPRPDDGDGITMATFKVVASNGLNVRSAPSTCGLRIQTFTPGYVFEASQVIKVSAMETWAKVGEGLFCAVVYNGTALAEEI